MFTCPNSSFPKALTEINDQDITLSHKQKIRHYISAISGAEDIYLKSNKTLRLMKMRHTRHVNRLRNQNENKLTAT